MIQVKSDHGNELIPADIVTNLQTVCILNSLPFFILLGNWVIFPPPHTANDSLLLCSIHAIQMQVVMYRGPRPPLDGLFYPSDPQTNQVPQ